MKDEESTSGADPVENHQSKITNRIGLLGGTFDPPHNGHLLLGEAALTQLELDSVLLMPVGDPTHKSRGDLTPVSQRIAMIALAISDRAQFQLDLTDTLRAEPHYTSSLLPLMQEKYPNAALWLVIGGDSLRDFAKWHEPEAILQQCRLAVLPRPGADIDWASLTAQFPTIRDRVDMLEGATLDLSSTKLRGMADNDERSAFVPFATARYIEHSGLYQPEDA